MSPADLYSMDALSDQQSIFATFDPSKVAIAYKSALKLFCQNEAV
ncbi:hypothetical protein SFB21_0121 [Acinetobacter bouvetii]|uniref:Uncharacterized protein n=1 Tax=Acinetobacter bouvetii TaxID=202951 RepID=A0A811GEP0_9GAMM|nr:hypothetical protein SFB21_0121 [Acinetobacter bouvetii]